MTEEEKKLFKEIYARQQEGYAFMEQERRERIRTTVTREVVARYDGIIEYSKSQPLRTSSGLVEMYQVLRKRPQ